MNQTADDFRVWMDARGLSSADVARDLGTEEQTIRKWRSQGVPDRRRPHVERYMENWSSDINRPSVSDEAIKTMLASQQNLVLRPEPEEFNAWCQAFKLSNARNLEEWAMEGLNRLAGLDEGRFNGTNGSF